MEDRRQPSWPMLGGIAAVAAIAAFGIARWTAPDASAPAPVEQPSAASGPVQLKIPQAYLQTANIVVEKVAAAGMGTDILAPATIASTPQGEAVVVARASGAITQINKRLGDSVRAGETLALVDSLDAATISADRSVAAAKVDLARRTYNREAGLFKQGVSPREDMEAAQSALAVAQAEASRASSVASAARVTGNGRSVSVVSPIAGKITAQTATLGSYVDPQAELFRVAASNAAQVEASVSADDARRVSPGDTATIVLGSGDTLAGTVRSVTPTVSGASQAATVVIVPAGNGRLLVGQGVQVRIRASTGGGKTGISVPEEAVQSLNGKDVVFVRTKDGFRAQPVLVGSRSGGVAQILSGLQAGASVATRNAFLLKAEATKGSEEEE
ncbi:Nickel and cobalt resistance protein cnrB [Novosphingobium sp. Rr 2-17]|uniref:efflux RND transporter periplasmic adaptor subunit n=1 Tax=Novosphingobium sp. Rr 2-17 TaxID=555793 RepID=UPI000269817D|nr:efflux RND transporter periplasmic adaptor subunit [Novosphingobium sp. Rr 2-17]EIZ81253.1 Nickel and cobalt resistance protein cnrB [Novosphingobium sp. Rr 2-17]